MSSDDDRQITTKSTRVVYRNPWMTVREDRIRRADGSDGIFGVVDKPDFALIIPVRGDHVVLVEQFRYPVGGRYAEFPQGSWEADATARPEDLARGELAEETGYQAGSIEHLGHLYEAYGYSNQGFDVFLATDLAAGTPNRSVEEQDLIAMEIPITEFERQIRAGEIKDAPTIAAWTLYRLRPIG